MDASQYKDYALTLLFLKDISDKYARQEDALLIIAEGSSFDDMIALKGRPILETKPITQLGCWVLKNNGLPIIFRLMFP